MSQDELRLPVVEDLAPHDLHGGYEEDWLRVAFAERRKELEFIEQRRGEVVRGDLQVNLKRTLLYVYLRSYDLVHGSRQQGYPLFGDAQADGHLVPAEGVQQR